MRTSTVSETLGQVRHDTPCGVLYSVVFSHMASSESVKVTVDDRYTGRSDRDLSCFEREHLVHNQAEACRM